MDLTGKHQQGFKRIKGTATAGALLQSIIASAADDKCYVVMASLDLSMAFDMVDTNLVIKRLREMGIPDDLIKLIREWLIGRSFYVQVGEDCIRCLDCIVGLFFIFTTVKMKGPNKLLNHKSYLKYVVIM